VGSTSSSSSTSVLSKRYFIKTDVEGSCTDSGLGRKPDHSAVVLLVFLQVQNLRLSLLSNLFGKVHDRPTSKSLNFIVFS